MKKKIFLVIIGLIAFVLLLLGASMISNLTLPTRSRLTERLSEVEKARVAEMFHLRDELGNTVWPEWGDADIPVIVHNEEYAFLLGYPGQPPAGWFKMPGREKRGGPWEPVPEDTYQGKVYYRQPLPDPQTTPENFTVLVGDDWTATLYTREYAEIAFYEGMQAEMPGFLRPLIPYRLLWRLVMGNTETYLEGLAHESFHALQGINASERLANAEQVARLENSYPWEQEEVQIAWQREMAFLHQAVKAKSNHESLEYTRKFLAQRQERRALAEISPRMVDYERKREWLEGLAKYAELTLGLTAGRSSDYEPIPAITDDPDFKNYTTQARFWSQQVNEIKRQGTQAGETRFYYSGMAQANLLDRFAPGWKEQIWQENIWLEDLLSEAINE